MPLMPGLLRRRGPASDAELRRHSFYSADWTSTPSASLDGRASEQIPRRPSAAEFLSPESALEGPSVTRTSAEGGTESVDLERSVSPPVQEENHKHRRFSMLKCRHASDSQLSTRGTFLNHLSVVLCTSKTNMVSSPSTSPSRIDPSCTTE
jgi:hypothetical protein